MSKAIKPYRGFEIDADRYLAPWGTRGDLWWASAYKNTRTNQASTMTREFYADKNNALTALRRDIDLREDARAAIMKSRRLELRMHLG